ncbi:nucleoplasmin-2 isoform X2 [Prinia subflava]|uniref:nucleoplasmin-2 isoform X2 n=1 Tax=Prinia subflava TaxID=208062 RepID=UPI002FE2F6A5
MSIPEATNSLTFSEGDLPLPVLWGCELSAARRSYTFRVPEEWQYEHKLLLCTVCLGANARDECHLLELVPEDGDSRAPVLLATLKPSVTPTVSLFGMELSPPVTFRLRAGSGPLCISGQLKPGKEAGEGEAEQPRHPRSPSRQGTRSRKEQERSTEKMK